MNDEKRAMIEEWIELHPVLMDRLETLAYVSGDNRNDDYSIRQSVLEKELQIYGVKTCFTPEEFMQVLYNNCPAKDEPVKDEDKPVKKENKMKGPKKEKLFCFPMECKYASITLKKDDKLQNISNIVKDNYSFNSLSEIRTFLRNKAKENNCEKVLKKVGCSVGYTSFIYLAYYSDNNGQYNKNGEFITYHILKIFDITKDKINIEDYFEFHGSNYQTKGIQFIIDHIWSL